MPMSKGLAGVNIVTGSASTFSTGASSITSSGTSSHIFFCNSITSSVVIVAVVSGSNLAIGSAVGFSVIKSSGSIALLSLV